MSAKYKMQNTFQILIQELYQVQRFREKCNSSLGSRNTLSNGVSNVAEMWKNFEGEQIQARFAWEWLGKAPLGIPLFCEWGIQRKVRQNPQKWRVFTVTRDGHQKSLLWRGSAGCVLLWQNIPEKPDSSLLAGQGQSMWETQFSFLTLLPHQPILGKKAAGTEAHGYGLSTEGVGPLASERCSVGQVLGNSDEGLGRVILKWISTGWMDIALRLV